MQKILNNWWNNIDKHILSAALILLFIGLIMILSSSGSVTKRINIGEFYFFFKHLYFIPLALIIIALLSMISLIKLRLLFLVILIISIIMCCIVIINGQIINGAKRWLNLSYLTIQPSEFLKPAFAIIVGWMLTVKRLYNTKLPNNILIATYLIISILLLSQPDFGQTIIITLTLATQVFVAETNLIIAFIITSILPLLGLILYFNIPYIKNRIDNFIDPNSINYQVNKGLDAISNGGIIGVGPGEGTVKNTLPDAHTDFIFAVIAEEFGYIACCCIILLFLCIILKSLYLVYYTKNIFISLAVVGLIIQFTLQIFINIGSVINLIPTKGITLPFISYGGSSVISISLIIGALLNLTRLDNIKQETK